MEKVRAWEESMVIPTYEVESEDPSPQMWNMEADRHTYPYTLQDKISSRKVDKSYRVVCLENRYLKVVVLPELGGHVYSLYDKTAGQEMLYSNGVIKPAMLAFRGAWIACGIEYNFCTTGASHTVTTISPIDYCFRENPDGSVSVYIGDLEWVHREKWSVKLTLHPDRAYLEQEVRLYNPTPVPQRYYFWSNAAAPANDDMRFVYPIAYGQQGEPFPIRDGVDLSWHKNCWPTFDIFGKDPREDFFGYYDHRKDFGGIHLANRHIVPGMKIWDWGNCPAGLIWAKILSDESGPYWEMQAGRLEHQGISEFLSPHTVEVWKEYWYPLAKIGPYCRATKDAAMSFQGQGQPGGTAEVKLGFYVTGELAGSQAVLRSNQRELFSQTVDLSPARPFLKQMRIDLGAQESELTASLVKNTGETIIEYIRSLGFDQAQPKPDRSARLPEIAQPPAIEPSTLRLGSGQALLRAGLEKTSVDQLYLQARQFDRDCRPLEAMWLYQVVLEKDPGESRANCDLGLIYFKQGLVDRASERFEAALKRDPHNTEAGYLRGVCLKHKRRFGEAEKPFWQLYYDAKYASVARFCLGEMALMRGNYAEAEGFFRSSLEVHPGDLKSQVWLALALRLALRYEGKQSRFQEAFQVLAQAYASAPLDYLVLHELLTACELAGEEKAAKNYAAEFDRIASRDVQVYLEVAAEYISIESYEDCLKVLARARQSPEKRVSQHPFVHYYEGYCKAKLGKEEEARRHYELGSSADRSLVFPNRLEDLEVLADVLRRNPDDAAAHYYLGNLLYSRYRAEEACQEWEASARLDDTFPSTGLRTSFVVHRNLGYYYWKLKLDLERAAAEYERAVELQPTEPRLYRDLDQIYASMLRHERRVELLTRVPDEGLGHCETIARLASAYRDVGDYDRALAILRGNEFTAREGYTGVWEIFSDTLLKRGYGKMQQSNYEAAIADFLEATTYPESLGIGEPAYPVNAQQWYLVGLCYEAMGREQESREYWLKAVEESQRVGATGPARFYMGLSHLKSGDAGKANEIFDGLIRDGESALKAVWYREKQEREIANAHYLMALAHAGKGDLRRAREHFGQLLQIMPEMRMDFATVLYEELL